MNNIKTEFSKQKNEFFVDIKDHNKQANQIKQNDYL